MVLNIIFFSTCRCCLCLWAPQQQQLRTSGGHPPQPPASSQVPGQSPGTFPPGGMGPSGYGMPPFQSTYSAPGVSGYPGAAAQNPPNRPPLPPGTGPFRPPGLNSGPVSRPSFPPGMAAPSASEPWKGQQAQMQSSYPPPSYPFPPSNPSPYSQPGVGSGPFQQMYGGPQYPAGAISS